MKKSLLLALGFGIAKRYVFPLAFNLPRSQKCLQQRVSLSQQKISIINQLNYVHKKATRYVTSTTSANQNDDSNCIEKVEHKKATSLRNAGSNIVSIHINRPECYYKNSATQNRWKRRVELEELHVGQALRGIVVQKLLEGKTGPKVYFDCGVGRYRRSNGSWKIQTAMLRLAKGMKDSVVKKKVARLEQRSSESGDGYVTLYVSRIFPSSDRLEVVLASDDVPNTHSEYRLIPASKLQTGQELVGTVLKLCDYGAFINVNANRRGLLHIQRVADLYGTYIPKQEGLKQFGIEVGSRIKVQVLSNSNKQLSFDFTDDVKLIAENERLEKDKISRTIESIYDVESATSRVTTKLLNNRPTTEYACFTIQSATSESQNASSTETNVVSNIDINVEENPYDEDYNDDDEVYDDYDEERKIEDQLGLGFY